MQEILKSRDFTGCLVAVACPEKKCREIEVGSKEALIFVKLKHKEKSEFRTEWQQGYTSHPNRTM